MGIEVQASAMALLSVLALLLALTACSALKANKTANLTAASPCFSRAYDKGVEEVIIAPLPHEEIRPEDLPGAWDPQVLLLIESILRAKVHGHQHISLSNMLSI